MELIDFLSHTSVLISIILGFFFSPSLRKSWRFLFLSLIFVLIINSLLKIIFREKRPENYYNDFEYHKPNHFGDYLWSLFDTHINQYGMPSGHTQLISFITSYIWIQTQSVFLFLINLFLLSLTSFQRVYREKHTTTQVICGALVGSLIAVFI